MKNKLSDLNNHLFAQLERMAEEGISAEQLEQEVKRTEAIVSVADQITRNADVADRQQRNATLIELNPAYADMARTRLAEDGGLFAEVAAE